MPKTSTLKPIEKALDRIHNRFLLTIVAARRWESLVAGAPPLVNAPLSEHKFETVLREIIEGHITVDVNTRAIQLEGEPQQEINDEPIFSEAFSPDAKSLKDVLGDKTK